MAANPQVATGEALSGRRDAYYWRTLARPFCFAAFGLGALLVSLIGVPVLALVTPDAKARRFRVRALLRLTLRSYLTTMRAARLLDYELRGFERLGRPGQLIVANHPTLLDVVFLLAFVPNAGCVVKHAILRNPLTRFAAQAAGFISNDPTHEMIAGAEAALREGQCLIMFPEGTRTVRGMPLRVQRGAANIAVRAATMLTPVTIRCWPSTLGKAERWYQSTARRVRFTLTVGEELPLDEVRRMRSVPLASRALNERLRQHFEGEARPSNEIY